MKQHLTRILQALRETRTRDFPQALDSEDLTRITGLSLNVIRDGVAYLEEKGYVVTQNRQVGTRIFSTLHLTAKGIDLLEGRVDDEVTTQPTDSILIVTVTKVETQAVLKAFSQATGEKWTRQPIGNKTYYNLGAHGGAPVFMVQSEMGTATPGGALLTVRQAIQDLRPQAVIMCGIAFGLRPDKQKLGDILVAKQLEYYEPQKVDLQRSQMPRGDRTTASERLLGRFRSGDIDWQGAPTHFGLVLSGEKLVNDPAFRDWLLKTEPEAIGGEMEGAGLYAAARDAKVDWILVKAICDWADGTKNNEAQPLAARNAAEFVLYVLQLGGWGGPEQSHAESIVIVSNQRLVQLQENLSRYFDAEEFRSLCFDLGVDYDSLRGEGKAAKARELVAFLERRGRISDLVALCSKLRPNVAWEGALAP